MLNRMKKLLMGIFIIHIFICGCSFGYEDYSAAGTVMGTIFTAGFRAEGAGNGAEVWTQLNQAGVRLENDVLSRRVEASEVSCINSQAGSAAGCKISEELADYLMLCREFSVQTDGAFDVTVGALSTLWGIDEAAVDSTGFEVPADEAVNSALALCGYEELEVSDNCVVMPQGMIIDLGAVGKGIYLAKAYDILKENCKYGVVAAGGSILTYGYKDGGQPWHVGIADPLGKADVIASISLEGSYFVSTSGDYERYVEVDGVRYHHILDTATGYPANSGLCSVTVIIPADKSWDGYFSYKYNSLKDSDISGLLSDAITTAVFVMGEEEGLKLARHYEVDILLVRNDGTMVMSDGMKRHID